MALLDNIADRVDTFLDEVFIPESVRRLLQRASTLIERENFEQALEFLERADEAHPDFHRTQFLMGRCHFGRGHYDDALEAFQRSLEQRDAPLTHFHAGLAAEQLEEWRLARRHMQEVLSSAEDLPYEFNVHFALGRINRQLGRSERALHELKKAVDPDVGDASDVTPEMRAAAAAALAELLLETGRGSEAEEVLAGVELPEARHDLLRVRARVAFESGDFETAADLFRRALDREADDVESMLGAARSHLAVNAPAQAREMALRASETLANRTEDVSPELYADTLTTLGEASQRGGDDDRALEYFEQAISVAGTPPAEASLSAGRLRLERGDHEAAVDHFRRCLETDDRDTRRAARLGLADARIQQGDIAAARRLLSEVDDLANPSDTTPSPDPEIECLRGLAALESGDPAEALVALQGALVGKPRPRLRERIEEARQRALRALEPDWELPEALSAPTDLERALDQLVDVLGQSQQLEPYIRRARALSEVLSKPLSVAILGEFNAGKSTLVNALLGEEVVPMGILPTTAHTGFIEYGARKAARVAYLDDRVDEVPYREARRRMEEETDEIDHLTFSYPHPQLRAVTFRDTPGFNALEEGHDAIAQSSLEEAEAILWVLDANQALSQTEFELLESIRDSSERVIVLLNKIDRVAPDAEDPATSEDVRELVDYVETHIGDHIAGCFPISAQQALKARTGGADAPASDSFETFETLLDERFIQRAGRLKTLDVRHRLRGLIDELDQQFNTWIADQRDREGRAEELSERIRTWSREHGEAEAARRADDLADQLDFVTRSIASEIQDALRPSGTFVSRMELTEEDRDFILELFGSRVDDILERARQDVLSEVDALELDVVRRTESMLESMQLSDARTVDRRMEGLFDQTRALRLLLRERVFGALRARVHGRLEAGGRAAIANLENQGAGDLDAASRELAQLFPDPHQQIDASLADWYREFFVALHRFSERTRRELQRVRLEINHRFDLTAFTDLLTS
jgi:small GTP-binding protein